MTEAARNPTAVRRELGQRLRGLRAAKDMTVAEAAERAGFSQSKLTKIELAQAVATRDDVLKMLNVYEETDPQAAGSAAGHGPGRRHQGMVGRTPCAAA